MAPAERTRRSWTALGLLLTLGLGSLPWPIWIDELRDTSHLLATEGVYWSLVAATMALVRFGERRPLASIGFRRPRGLDLAAAVGATILITAILAALWQFAMPAPAPGDQTPFATLQAQPAWWLAISTVRAGVSEEVLFRGYPIERLRELTGRPTLAALIPLVPFTLAHVGPWGWAHVIIAGSGGAMLTLLYCWRRNLWTSIVAHCLIDGLAMAA